MSCTAQIGMGRDNCYWDSAFSKLCSLEAQPLNIWFFLVFVSPFAPLCSTFIVKRSSKKQSLLPLTLSHQESFWEVLHEGTNMELISLSGNSFAWSENQFFLPLACILFSMSSKEKCHRPRSSIKSLFFILYILTARNHGISCLLVTSFLVL